MKEIEQIYFNDFGVAFHWKKDAKVFKDKVQVIFRDTGFYLTQEELAQFAAIIEKTCKANSCAQCCHRAACHKFLLKTPLNQIDLAVNNEELMYIKDLVEGTLFNIDLSDYLGSLCKN